MEPQKLFSLRYVRCVDAAVDHVSQIIADVWAPILETASECARCELDLRPDVWRLIEAREKAAP
jgi:hypothetical protein